MRECVDVAISKTASAVLNEPVIPIATWERIYGQKSFGVKTAAAADSRKKVATDQSKYLLSHCTIMASVHCEDEPYDFRIRPSSAAFVNSNFDCWSNVVLRMSYKTFLGAFNFVDHFQNTKANKGHILDAVLRRVNLTPQDFVYYVDILVATDLVHEELISDIRAGKVQYMSMGCVTDLITCTYCGAQVTDTGNYCSHLFAAKGTFIADEDGIPRRVAELCGHKSLPNGGVRFVEASWLRENPAFPGASRRNIVSDCFVGPKSPYTTRMASAGGLRKAASAIPQPLNLHDAKLIASLRRQLR